jgi:hypothetical protein
MRGDLFQKPFTSLMNQSIPSMTRLLVAAMA